MNCLFKCEWLLIVVISFACSCNTEIDNRKSNTALIMDAFVPQVADGQFSKVTFQILDSLELSLFFNKYREFLPYRETISQFYLKRNWQMVWFDSVGRIEQVVILYNKIKAMEEDGIPYEIHYYDAYTEALQRADQDSTSWQELMFTCQYLHYAEKMTIGLKQQEILDKEWFIPRKKVKYELLLTQMLAENSSSDHQLNFFQYELLRKKLIHLQKIEKRGGWILPDKTNKVLKKGDSAKVIVQIRERLVNEDYLLGNQSSNYYDQSLEIAVKNFQEIHGIQADGILGKKTLSIMRIPVRSRIEQVMVNMERCRWLPMMDNSVSIIVNIPEYRLHVMKNDVILFSMAAIVGKETNKTAIFSGKINEIVFNPYWNIPTSIKEKEIIPQVKKNPLYLKQNNMEWQGNQLRQLPGPDNALGKIKFLFPNPFNIYLHDTPNKLLFENTKRSFSHGCIRIGDPVKLAQYLLSFENGWNNERIKEELFQKKEKRVLLNNKVPVYIIYLTAFVDEKGNLNFRDDVYKRDEILATMLLKK